MHKSYLWCTKEAEKILEYVCYNEKFREKSGVVFVAPDRASSAEPKRRDFVDVYSLKNPPVAVVITYNSFFGTHSETIVIGRENDIKGLEKKLKLI